MAASGSSPKIDRGAERAVVLTVALGTMLAPLNSTMIVVALPRVMDEFGAGILTAGWLVTGYLVAMAALQPVAGRLGDWLGRRWLVLGGLLCFGLASLSAAMSVTLLALVLSRVFQGVAGAIAFPNGAALVREAVPAERRAGGFGMVGAAVALAAAGGPPLGGLLAELGGWRAIFAANAPLVLAALVTGWYWLPAERGGVNQPTPERTGGLIGTVLRRPTFIAASAETALSNFAMYGTLLSVPLLLSNQDSWSSFRTGLVLASLSVAMAVSAPLGGHLADRFGRRWLVMAGFAILTTGLAPLALSGGALDPVTLVIYLGVAGGGLGLSQAGLQAAALEAVDVAEAGMAAGILSTSRYAGSIVCSGLLAGVFGSTQGDMGGLGIFLLFLPAAALLSAILSLSLPGRTGLHSSREVALTLTLSQRERELLFNQGESGRAFHGTSATQCRESI